MHIRKDTRDNIASLLNTVFDPLGTVKINGEAINVYKGYRAPLTTGEMPGIILYFMDDNGHDLDQVYSARKSRLVVEVFVKESSDTEADIDYVCEHVESTLHLNRQPTGVENIEYTGYTRILDSAGAPVPGQISMNFSVTYNVTYSPPAGDAVNFTTAHATIEPNTNATTEVHVNVPQ